MSARMRSTVISDFHRSIRDEPAYYIYKHKVWPAAQNLEAKQLQQWLQERYVSSKKGNRYRIKQFIAANGERYVDCVLLETLTDNDLMIMKMRWGFTREPVVRTARKRIRLTKEQVAKRANVLAEFYKSIGYDF